MAAKWSVLLGGDGWPGAPIVSLRSRAGPGSSGRENIGAYSAKALCNTLPSSLERDEAQSEHHSGRASQTGLPGPPGVREPLLGGPENELQLIISYVTWF